MRKAGVLQDAALGCLLGACAGDAAGAVLEFIGHTPTAAEVEHALRMPGGGCWRVAPGQITDDGELTLCLAHALVGASDFSIERVAQNYDFWIRSQPFDIGRTTYNALARKDVENGIVRKHYGGVMMGAARELNMGSKANGSLMRISPLGIWGYRFTDEQLAGFARSDSALTHPNPSCQDAVACYVIAIASLMRELGDYKMAFEHAWNWAAQNANDEVKSWLEDARNNQNIPYSPQEGFIKVAFTHAFRHLWAGTGYEEAIRETLAGGGDTDTNACIVGGLVGAVCGAEAIPEKMKQAVLNCDTRKSIHPRPEFLHTTRIPELVKGLIG